MKNSKQGLYKEYTDKERFLFRQHASVYDTASALTKSKKCFPKLIRGSHPKKSLSIYDVDAPFCSAESMIIQCKSF